MIGGYLLESQWAWAKLAMIAYTSFVAGVRIHFSVGIFVFTVLFSAVFSHLGGLPSSESAFVFLLFVFFFSFLGGEDWAGTIPFLLGGICLLSIGLTFYQMGGIPRGFSGNPSMNGCLIAITLPILLGLVFKYRPTTAIFWPLSLSVALSVATLIALLATRTSIPLGVLFVVWASGMIAHRGIRYVWASCVGAGALLFCIGYFSQPDVFLSSSGRFAGWRMIFRWWVDSGHWGLGLGTGAGSIVFERLHFVYPAFAPLGVWAHNDFLGLLFDNGLVGLASLLVMLGYALFRARENYSLFASITGFIATAFFNFPIHLPAHAFVGASLVWLAHRGEHG